MVCVEADSEAAVKAAVEAVQAKLKQKAGGAKAEESKTRWIVKRGSVNSLYAD